MLPTYTTNDIIYVVPLLSLHATYIYNKRYHICCSTVEPTCYLHIQQTISYMLFHCWAHILPTYITNDVIYAVPLLSPHVTYIYNKRYHICCSIVEPTCYLYIQQTISYMLFHCWAHMLPTYTINDIIYVVPLLSPHVTYIYKNNVIYGVPLFSPYYTYIYSKPIFIINDWISLWCFGTYPDR